MDYLYGVDSSSRFPFTARTDRHRHVQLHTQLITKPTQWPVMTGCLLNLLHRTVAKKTTKEHLQLLKLAQKDLSCEGQIRWKRAACSSSWASNLLQEKYLEALLGPFHGTIAVPSVTRCRCRCRGHRTPPALQLQLACDQRHLVTGNVTATRSSEWAQHFSNASCCYKAQDCTLFIWGVGRILIFFTVCQSHLRPADGA